MAMGTVVVGVHRRVIAAINGNGARSVADEASPEQPRRRGVVAARHRSARWLRYAAYSCRGSVTLWNRPAESMRHRAAVSSGKRREVSDARMVVVSAMVAGGVDIESPVWARRPSQRPPEGLPKHSPPPLSPPCRVRAAVRS